MGRHLENGVDSEQYWLSRKSFYETGFALISYLLPDEVKRRVDAEINDLIAQQSIRRDLTLPQTSNSPRRMRNVTAEDIRAHDGVVREMYESPALRGALSAVAGEAVLDCPYQPEEYVITHLERPGDTHGWHWDDYSFGVIYVVDVPPTHLGGFVQTVPNTSWDKEDPQVFQHLIGNPIHSYALRPGDMYLLRTDTTLHRVHPLEPGGRRTIVNMAFAAERDLNKQISHETMEDLFSV
ncbi:hypothetical protein [Actinoplanes lobatus]|uniref:ArpA protein n=1 Tax=Actinoplanes lobatus TaxID=113568 RepID=A0A7W7MEN9_9ACTN|nr:hypothetical protein [Actinoplanes lobatus]MBB4747452.1 hypothetical protein [Actinoplanes lobatus]